MSTLKEIAKRANVSVATVSYAINNSDQISQDTRVKVLEIIKEMNYKPNRIAKSLRTNKTYTIGIIAEDIAVFSAPEIINGIGEYAEDYDYYITLNNLRLCKRIGNNFSDIVKYKKSISGIIENTLARQLDGIVYIGTHNRDVTEIVENIDKPLVFTYCHANGESHYCVNIDDEAAAYKATSHLIDFAHRKIAVITGLVDSMPCQERLKGYQKAIMDHNLIINPLYVKVGNWEYESGYLKAKELLSNEEPPTAIFAMNDLMAIGAIDAAREMGLCIPRDLSVIGFDNRECSFYCVPQLTTVDLPLNEMGKMACKLLIDIINNNIECRDRNIKLECKIVERQSVSQPKV